MPRALITKSSQESFEKKATPAQHKSVLEFSTSRVRWLAPALFVFGAVSLFFYRQIHTIIAEQLSKVVALIPASGPSDTMQIVLSIILTVASLFVVLNKGYGPKDKHWAYSTIGTVLGFWLRGR